MSVSMQIDKVRSLKIGPPHFVEGLGWQRTLIINYYDGTYDELSFMQAQRRTNLEIVEVETTPEAIDG